MHFVRTCINKQTYNLLWSKDQVGSLKSPTARAPCATQQGRDTHVLSFSVDHDEAEGAAVAGV